MGFALLGNKPLVGKSSGFWKVKFEIRNEMKKETRFVGKSYGIVLVGIIFISINYGGNSNFITTFSRFIISINLKVIFQ